LYVRADLQTRFAGDIERVRTAGGHVVAAEATALVRMAGGESRHQGVVALMQRGGVDCGDAKATAEAFDPQQINKMLE